MVRMPLDSAWVFGVEVLSRQICSSSLGRRMSGSARYYILAFETFIEASEGFGCVGAYTSFCLQRMVFWTPGLMLEC